MYSTTFTGHVQERVQDRVQERAQDCVQDRAQHSEVIKD